MTRKQLCSSPYTLSNILHSAIPLIARFFHLWNFTVFRKALGLKRLLVGIFLVFSFSVGMTSADGESLKVTPFSGEVRIINSFEDAMSYANTNGGGTVELLSDVNFFHPYFIPDTSSADYSKPYHTIIVSTSITLLGNGHTINISPGAEISVRNGTLTLGDNSGTNSLIFDGGGNWYEQLKSFQANPATVFAEGWGDFGYDTHMGCTPIVSVSSNSTLNMNSGVILQNRIYDGIINTIYDYAALAVNVHDGGTFNMYGGIIQNFHSYPLLHSSNVAEDVSAIVVQSNGNFIMKAGILRDNSVLNNTINIPISDYDHAGGIGTEMFGDGPACGGALSAFRAVINISGGKIYENKADSGGALYFSECKNVSLSNVEIYNNVAAIPEGIDYDWGYGWGGAIYQSWNSEISLGQGCYIHDNQADSGGGIFIGGSNYPWYFFNYSWRTMHTVQAFIDYFSMHESLTMNEGSAICNNIGAYEASDIDSMPYVEINLIDAVTMNKTFHETGCSITGWFQDYNPRYNIDDTATAFTIYTPDEVKTKVASSGIELIAAPSISQINYYPNGGTGEQMESTVGSVGQQVSISSNSYTYGTRPFVSWNTKSDGSGISYTPNDLLTLTGTNLDLFAQWAVPVTIVKIWDDEENKEKNRPSHLNISLLLNGVLLKDYNNQDAILTLEPDGTGEWDGVIFLPAGVNYSLLQPTEDNVANYIQSDKKIVHSADGSISVTFINKQDSTPSTTSFSVRKIWQGADKGNIALQLYADGAPVSAEFSKAGTPATYTVSDLPMYNDDGSEIIYSATETHIPDYLTVYLNVSPYSEYTDAIYNGGTIVNREITEVRIKKRWIGPEGKASFQLYQDGEPIEWNDIEKDGEWYIWNNLPKLKDGKYTVYTVKEKNLSNYHAIYPEGRDYAKNGETIVNYWFPPTGDKSHLIVLALVTSIAGILILRRRR